MGRGDLEGSTDCSHAALSLEHNQPLLIFSFQVSGERMRVCTGVSLAPGGLPCHPTTSKSDCGRKGLHRAVR